MEPCVIVTHVKMAAIATLMVIILIPVLVHQTGMDLIVSIPTRCLHVIITHVLITELVIPMVPMDFIVIVPMDFMANSVSINKHLHALLHRVKREEHVSNHLTLIIVHVLWVIMETTVKPILVKQHVLLLHVKTKLHAMTMEPTIHVNAVVDIME